ncbi:MAG: TPM domain-containing protein [Cryobacterium sp.]|nr:TPM domain-containing protein [Oligoflexia bacterium]
MKGRYFRFVDAKSLARTLFLRSVLILTMSSVAIAVEQPLPPVPSRPLQGLVDGGKALPLILAKTLERLLLEHQSLTGETIDVYTLAKTPEDQTFDAYTSRVFAEWRSTAPKPPSTVVLFFDLEEKKMATLSGVGLDSLMAERGGDSIAKKFGVPEMRHGRSDRAVILSTRRVFEILESPVFVNGKFDTELREAGFLEPLIPVAESESGRHWWIWILFGSVLIILVGYRILAVEVHYQASGWQRIPPWENFVRYVRSRMKKSPELITGGGVSGNY